MGLNIGLNLTITHKHHLQELKSRAGSFYDLEFLKAIAPENRSLCLDHLDASHSQLRQDLFALSQVDFKRGGFFVEFGATDGISLSNSYLMETAFGWSGILAEPARGWHERLQRNWTCAIETRCVWRASNETLLFTEAPRGENSAISTLVKRSRKLRGQSYPVETISLNDLLRKHQAPDVVDYMSIDTEGSELDILKAFDFDRWSARVMTIEHNFAPQRQALQQLMNSNGYTRVMEPVSRFDDWYIRSA